MESTRKFRLLSQLSLLLGLIVWPGCGPGSQTAQPIRETPASSRPALKIWIVDAPELEKEISVRWQAASDQTLEIENVAGDTIAKRVPFNADIVIYPGMLLGELIRNESIGILPAEAIAKRDSDGAKDTVVSSWPVRWRNASTFGGRLYAIPLGAINLVAAMSSLDSTPLQELHPLLSSRDLNTKSMEKWTQFLTQAELALSNGLEQRKLTLEDLLSKIRPQEKAWLVDRFLFIASTTNARSRGLFDLVKMESRLNQPEFSFGAKVLSRLARLSPDSIAEDPTTAWKMLFLNSNATASFVIGWPSSISANSAEVDLASNEPFSVAPLAWNPGRGLIASVGKKTRQTAVSCQFLVWLSEPEQREALRAVCTRVELAPEQNDRNNVRDDYRSFQSINSRDSRVEPMELSLRMANADQYRAILAESLVDAIREPDQVDSIMNACASKWNELTAKLGVETQRSSEERSLGYGK